MKEDASNWTAIKDQLQLNHLPPDIKCKYENLFKKYSDVFSRHKFDIGYSDAVPHSIRLKSQFPIYSPQFRVPEAHKVEILKQLEQLKKAGCLELSTSPYNSPIFLVQKKDGSSRIVLDYRKLNAQSLPDKYSIRDVKTCLDDVGKSKSTIFSCLDITSSYHQVALEHASRPLTSFHVPGTPKLQWTRSPMGLAGSGSTFSKLMDIVLQNLDNVLNYIDDILTHSKTHEEQIKALENVLQRLRRFGLKINPQKCLFGLDKVSYLGFEIDKNGVSPGATKSEAIKKFPDPDTPKKIRQFLGLANYFRTFIRHFTEISAPLVHLTCPKTNWTGGQLPNDAKEALETLKNELSRRPVMAFPDFNLPFTLYCDASAGDENNPGGLGAILTQKDDDGNLKAISYLSRTLKPHERSASAYALEMKSAVWAIKNFHHYLKGRPFTVVSDNQPLVTKSKAADKSINKLQQLLLEYDAQIVHLPGSKNEIADALSRNATNQSNDLDDEDFLLTSAIDAEAQGFMTRQRIDGFTGLIIHLLQNKADVDTSKIPPMVMNEMSSAFLDAHGILRKKNSKETPAYLPKSMIQDVLRAGHASLLAGHPGINKTKEKILNHYYWPGANTDIENFVKSCPKCQLGKSLPPPKYPLQSLPIPDGPNQRVHIDLMGPLKSSAGYQYIWVATDAFTKYAITAPLYNKAAATVAATFVDKWITRFTAPKVIVTDNGKEFKNKLAEALETKLGIKHSFTSPYHPQTNSSAESYNRSIIKYMKTVLDDSRTTEWHKWLPAMELSYNNTLHKTIMTTPFALTHTFHPSLPFFDLSKPNEYYKKPQDYNEVFNRIKKAFFAAYKQSSAAIKQQEKNFNKSTRTREFIIGQKVMIWSTKIGPDITTQNKKFMNNYTGPYFVVGKVNDQVFKVAKFPHSKQYSVAIDRIKEFKYSDLFSKHFAGPDIAAESKQTPTPSGVQHNVAAPPSPKGQAQNAIPPKLTPPG